MGTRCDLCSNFNNYNRWLASTSITGTRRLLSTFAQTLIILVYSIMVATTTASLKRSDTAQAEDWFTLSVPAALLLSAFRIRFCVSPSLGVFEVWAQRRHTNFLIALSSLYMPEVRWVPCLLSPPSGIYDLST